MTSNNNWYAEIIQTFDGLYYINLWIDEQVVAGLPEYVRYSTLRSAVKRSVGIELPKQSELHFVKSGHNRYAYVDGSDGLHVLSREEIESSYATRYKKGKEVKSHNYKVTITAPDGREMASSICDELNSIILCGDFPRSWKNAGYAIKRELVTD